MKYFAVAVLTLSLAGCQSLGRSQTAAGVPDNLPASLSPAEILALGQASSQRQAWDEAIRHYDILQQRAPEGPQVAESLLEEAHAYFRKGDLERADAALAQFVRSYPNHPRTDYALYLKAQVEMDRPPGPLEQIADRYVKINPAERDQLGMQEAYVALQTLITRYPQSAYVADAQVRLATLYNQLAEREIIVARHYAERGAWLAAANRANHVLQHFPQSTSVDEALAVQITAYDQLGLVDLAQNARRQLHQAFPSSPYVADPGKALQRPRRLSV